LRNNLKTVAVVLALWLAASAAHAETFYAASVRTAESARANGAGTLYTIDRATTAAKVVAPIRLDGVHAIGVTGLAVHPRTGVFYGITGGFSKVAPHSLVTIDPEKGDATLVGPLGAVGSDVGFSPDGTLYAWLPEINRLGTIDLARGTVTPKGPSGIEAVSHTGALAIVSSEMGYVAASGPAGTLDFLDLATGTRRLGPALKGAPFPYAITNLSYSPSGRLYAVNANSGVPAETMLVLIDPATGSISPIGALPNDIEGLIFAERPAGFSIKDNWGTISFWLAAAILLAICTAMWRTSRH